MEALKLSITTIVFIFLFVAPGAIFNFVVTRWVFSTGRYNNSKIASIIVAIILSSAMIITLDRPFSKNILKNVTQSNFFTKQISNNHLLTRALSSKKIFDTTLEIFGETEKVHEIIIMDKENFDKKFQENKSISKNLLAQKENFYFLIASGAILVIFSFFSSIVLSMCLKLIESIIKESYINNSILYFTYLIRYIASKFNFNISLTYNMPFPKRVKDIIEPLITYAILFLFVFFIILSFILGMLSLLILICSVLATWLLQYSLYKILNLFKHPFHENFFSYQLDYSIPIIEIRTNSNYLVKGIMKAFVPLNHQELYALTISNVVQYHLQNPDVSKHFSRKARTMHEFENQDSNLTILMSNVLDFNIWLLNSIKTPWKFEINSREDISNQLWYLRTLINRNKLGFDVENLNVNMNYKYAFDFIFEVSKVIDAEYRTDGISSLFLLGKIYKIKKSELYFFLLKNTRELTNKIKKSTLTIDEIEELNQKKIKIINFINKSRKE